MASEGYSCWCSRDVGSASANSVGACPGMPQPDAALNQAGFPLTTVWGQPLCYAPPPHALDRKPGCHGLGVEEQHASAIGRVTAHAKPVHFKDAAPHQGWSDRVADNGGADQGGSIEDDVVKAPSDRDATMRVVTGDEPAHDAGCDGF